MRGWYWCAKHTAFPEKLPVVGASLAEAVNALCVTSHVPSIVTLRVVANSPEEALAEALLREARWRPLTTVHQRALRAALARGGKAALPEISYPWDEYVASIRGAPMGRRDVVPGRTWDRRRMYPDEPEVPVKLHLQKVPAADGGDYDPGGAYWGSVAGSWRPGPDAYTPRVRGQHPLWCAWGYVADDARSSVAGQEVRVWLRGASRDEVKAEVTKIVLQGGLRARFYK